MTLAKADGNARYLDWFPAQKGANNCGDAQFSLDELRAKFDVRDLGCGWLVLQLPVDGFWLHFAVVDFAQSETNGDNTLVSVLFCGEGPMGALRECRHTYWGDDGYVFYPNGALITAAFAALAEFFDDMIAEPSK